MATRGAPLSPGHVEGLNVVDVEFYGVERVVSAWRAYHDHLTHYPEPDASGKVSDAALSTWSARSPDLLADLLFEMASHLKLQMDKVALKRAAYFPRGHYEIEQETTAIRKGLASMLSKGYLPVVDVVRAREELEKIASPSAGGSLPGGKA